MTTNSSLIEIDGSFGEAGGQILRTACALSAIIKKPCHIWNIRKNRPKPGLQTQHLLGVQALAQLCQGKLEGDFLGSSEIKFYPGEIIKEKISLSIPTAASVTLILQSLIPVSLFAPFPIEISFNGGATDTFFSPTIDHFRYVFLKILEKMGPRIEINVLRRGYYPEGGAKIEVKIFPIIKTKDAHYQGVRQINVYTLKPLNLIERGEFKKILVISGASNHLKDKKVAERQIAGVREILGRLKLPIEEKIEYYDTRCPGSSICIISQFENTLLGADSLGKLGKPAEQVGRECALQLLEEEKTRGCVDRFLTDQLLLYLALPDKESQIKIAKLTSHAQTNMWVIQKFLLGKFELKDDILKWIPKWQ